LHLKQFAAYKMDSPKKRKARGANPRRHAHQHVKNRDVNPKLATSAVEDKQLVVDKRQMVTATIDGIVQSWMNDYFGLNGAPAPTPASVPSQPDAPSQPAAVEPSPQPAPSDSPNPSISDSIPNQYSRIGYYDAATQHLDGLTFLGNHGGAGSGVFD
jgi:hypothetical protein